MNWTKEEIIDEVLETMEFSPSEEKEGYYTDNLGCWRDQTIEDLIYLYVDRFDDNKVTDKKEIKEVNEFIYSFCTDAKRLFNVGGDLDYFIKEYGGK